MNKKSERYGTCSDCVTPDTFLFCKGRCRQCHFDHRDGKEPGSTIRARRAAQAEKISEPKRGKKGNEKSGTIKVTTGTVDEKATDPVCDHVIGLDIHPLMGTVVTKAMFRLGEIVEHKNEDCSDLTLFSFCPKCGKKLNLTRPTIATAHQTIFRETEATA